MTIRRSAVLLASVFLLGGCSSLLDGDLFWPDAARPASPSLSHTDVGLAALAKGEFEAAEQALDAALAADPHDVYALLAKAILLQNTNKPLAARQLYQRLVILDPQQPATVAGWTDLAPMRVVDIARRNLAQSARMDPAGSGQAPAPAAGVTVPAKATTEAKAAPATPGPGAPLPIVVSAARGAEDAAIIARFDTLRRLLENGVITAGEHQQRRKANLGGLLPLTGAPPAPALAQPVAPADHIMERLRSLNHALSRGAILPKEFDAERARILDGLMPIPEPGTGITARPPSSVFDAAAEAARLERLQAAGLISPAEAERERAAVDAALRPKAAAAPTTAEKADKEPKGKEPQAKAPAMKGGKAAGTPKPAPKAAEKDVASGGKVGPSDLPIGSVVVHLASFRTEEGARAGWAKLVKAHTGLLGALRPDVVKADIPGKGTFYRLRGGPVSSLAAAQKACAELKARRLFCQPTLAGME